MRDWNMFYKQLGTVFPVLLRNGVKIREDKGEGNTWRILILFIMVNKKTVDANLKETFFYIWRENCQIEFKDCILLLEM